MYANVHVQHDVFINTLSAVCCTFQCVCVHKWNFNMTDVYLHFLTGSVLITHQIIQLHATNDHIDNKLSTCEMLCPSAVTDINHSQQQACSLTLQSTEIVSDFLQWSNKNVEFKVKVLVLMWISYRISLSFGLSHSQRKPFNAVSLNTALYIKQLFRFLNYYAWT